MIANNDLLPQTIDGYEIDQLDLNIIKFLQQNGRIAYSDIARSIDAPEATIRYRVKRLIDEKIISISAFINTGKIKYENVAYIELEVTPTFLEANISDLIAMENISYVASVTGEFDLMLEYIYRDNDDLLNFINSLKSNPSVKRLNSRTILKIHKAQYPARIQP
ncbi:Lrp/AsnC family transcriptional regulator [Leptothoe sp. PORK10 BA2]|uniref:Lrp/AsnC family transcriptional regulator n=1 Tax=Leptothoe sp. PORK10 BA2 TaxID=3110254 RepID=UPI002B217FAD|nr:Lrp/AsnC family transcriptional regulator [Leptothoe sp. PORK10 BA2]MEA5464675.1 Lrp/AsnC family transcriptional regulator [Leptothoe sp. PORK10 BA2]